MFRPVVICQPELWALFTSAPHSSPCPHWPSRLWQGQGSRPHHTASPGSVKSHLSPVGSLRILQSTLGGPIRVLTFPGEMVYKRACMRPCRSGTDGLFGNSTAGPQDNARQVRSDSLVLPFLPRPAGLGLLERGVRSSPQGLIRIVVAGKSKSRKSGKQCRNVLARNGLRRGSNGRIQPIDAGLSMGGGTTQVSWR